MFIKNPGKSHPGFRILDPKSNPKTIKSKELKLINTEYINRLLSFDRARAAVEALRATLEKPKAIAWLPENQQIADEYWRIVGSQKQNRAPQAARDRINLAVRRLGGCSLRAPSHEIAEKIGHLDASAHRNAVGVIRALCRFKGIALFLQPKKQVITEPEYLTKPPLLPRKEDRLFILAAFGTGARYGEVFAFKKEDLRKKGTHIFIAKQRYRDWKLGPTKNDRRGQCFIIPKYRKAVLQWIEDVPEETKRAMRRRGDPYEAFKKMCPSLTLHNLRHSYAHYMLEQGASLEELAEWMRDRMATIERYYLSWVQSDTKMDANIRRFG